MISGTGNGGMVLCKPPEVIQPIIIALLPDLLNTAVQQIPDKVIIIKPSDPGVPKPGTGAIGVDPISTLHLIQLMMQLSYILPLVFLLLITLLVVRSIKSWLRWWGIPSFISGLITLGLGISVSPVFNAAWTMFIIPRISTSIPSVIAGVGKELIRSIVHSIAQEINLIAFILLAIGIAAWIGSSFLKTKNRTIEPDMPVPPAVTAS